jgi:hypothetical protein
VASFIRSASGPSDAILTRSASESLNLSPYFPESDRTQTPVGAYTEAQSQASLGTKVFVVREEPFVASKYPARSFGNIQVITYPSVAYSRQLIMIRDDILRSISVGDLSPELTDDYSNLWQIDEKLAPDDPSNFKYYQLYMLCLQLTDRQRNIALPLQYWEARQTVEKTILNGP